MSFYYYLQNSNPELAKSFQMKITSVQLITSTGAQSRSEVGLWISDPGNTADVVIAEHGISRGFIQFNVTRVSNTLFIPANQHAYDIAMWKYTYRR